MHFPIDQLVDRKVLIRPLDTRRVRETAGSHCVETVILGNTVKGTVLDKTIDVSIKKKEHNRVPLSHKPRIGTHLHRS